MALSQNVRRHVLHSSSTLDPFFDWVLLEQQSFDPTTPCFPSLQTFAVVWPRIDGIQRRL